MWLMRKSNLILVLTFGAVTLPVVFGSCRKKSGSTNVVEDKPKKTGEYTISDSNYVDDITPREKELMVDTFYAALEETKFALAYPVTGPEALVKAVRKWENTLLSQSFNVSPFSGDMNNAKEVFDYYRSKMHYYNEEWMEFQIDEIRLDTRAAAYTTFIYYGYEYAGGAHGMGGFWGVTFLNSSGRQFDWSDININSTALYDNLAKGLMEYFDVSTFDELSELLPGDIYSPRDIPLPSTEPWLSRGELVLLYQSYELGPYSYGQPMARIPLSEANSFFTASGLEFLN